MSFARNCSSVFRRGAFYLGSTLKETPACGKQMAKSMSLVARPRWGHAGVKSIFPSCQPLVQQARGLRNQSEGDKDLLLFLKEEIAYEQENVMEVPKFQDFKISMEGTHVTLSRKYNGETITVEFNINENINVDEAGEEEGSTNAENAPASQIVSYPSFSVRIAKPSGLTLHFNCACNTGMDDDPDADEEDQTFDLFRFDNVCVYKNKLDKADVYEAETDNMDGNLYSMLITTLTERGINGQFVNDLLDLSTAVEHRHYVNFLQSLQEFVSEK